MSSHDIEKRMNSPLSLARIILQGIPYVILILNLPPMAPPPVPAYWRWGFQRISLKEQKLIHMAGLDVILL